MLGAARVDGSAAGRGIAGPAARGGVDAGGAEVRGARVPSLASGNVLGLGCGRGGGVDPIGMRGPGGTL